MFVNPFKKQDYLPVIAPELKAKIAINYLETLTTANDPNGNYAGAEIMAAQIIIKIMDETTKAVNAHGNIKDNFKPEERQARNALYFHKMMVTQAGAELFKNVYDYLIELLKEYEAATEK